MRWRNHKLVTFSCVYSLTGGLPAAFAAMAGAVLPDVLELRGLIPHRTITHFLWLWMVLCGASWLTFKHGGASSILMYILFFVTVGAVLHICQDALSLGGVPLWSPFGQSIGLQVYRTKTIGEEITVLGIVVIFAVIAWSRGFTEADYVHQQMNEVGQIAGGIANGWR